jgi:hypothetical protein
MTIEELHRKREISVRSYHVCKENNLNSIKELKEYYYKHKSFDKFQKCGRKSNEELIEICNKYQVKLIENKEIELKKEKNLVTIISVLTRVQREVINSFILVNTKSLSVRSHNVILSYLNGNLKVKNFVSKILIPNSFNLYKLKNIGIKSIKELEIYITIIKEYLIEVSQSEDESKLISLKNKLLIQRTFSISKIPSEILETESIFLIVNFLLNENAFFEKDRTLILKKALKIYKEQKEITLEEISEKVNLTSERVRQIRKFLVDTLFDQLIFLKNFNDDINQKYNIDRSLNHIVINDTDVERINSKNEVSFSKEFIFFTLYSYISDTHSLVGNVQDVLLPQYFKARNRHNWNNFYLIEKEIVKEIDFNALANDIESRISDRIEESYSFSFKSYLSKFLNNNNIVILDLAFPIAEKIVNDEFELYLDLDENIIFKRNTNKQAYEYSYEALEQLGKPSKVKGILEKVLELHPNYNTDEAKIRVSMKRKNGFVPIGRKSVFGLKKWEKELDNFKGGTIRTISEEFLLNFNEPQHKKEIEKYVKQFRPKTNANSIYNNLYIDESNTFVFYENYYIGISSKKYSNDFKILSKTASPSKHTWEESLEILKDFTDKENRLPNSSGCPESEKKLYRWFNIQKVKCYDGKLDKIKENLIQEFDEKFAQINRNKSSNSTTISKEKKDTNRNKYSLTELISFIIEHKKIPDSRIIEERNLYQFYYRNKKNLQQNITLTIEEGELIHLIKKYGSANRNSKYSINDLISFFKENERIPDPKAEKDLYHYYHRQKRKLSNLNVFSENELKLINLIELYKSTSLRVVHNIQELINFVSINKRLPSSKNINESKLYQFYYRKKQLFNNQELTQEEEIQFIEVAKLLQNIKYENKGN